MILSPLPHSIRNVEPIGVMNGDGSIDSEDGARVFYCTSITAILRTVRRQGGIGTAIRSPERYRWLSFRHGDKVFYPVGQSVSLSEVAGFRDHCHSLGISPHSLQAMGFYLLRQSLAGTLLLSDTRSIPFKQFPAGAFTFAREGEWEKLYQSDIVAAYLHALGTMNTPISYSHTRRANVDSLCSIPFGFALVSVRGDTRFTPRMDTKGTTVYGRSYGWSGDVLLSFSDLRVARIMGCAIRIRGAWIPTETTEPFLPFLRQMTSLRSRDCSFRRVAKLATNSVWGSFTAGSTMKEIHFLGNGKTSTYVLPTRRKLCQPLAFCVIGSLRERIILEGMGREVVQAHTDGILSRVPIQTGEMPGDWRVSGWADRACIVRPSCYSVTVNGETTYKVSGHSGTSDRLRDMFRERIDRDSIRP